MILPLPIGADGSVCADRVEQLNQILVYTITLRDLYKEHHCQVANQTFYQLHLPFDKHCEEQVKLVDGIAERIQLLGGVSIAMAADAAETPRGPRPLRRREVASGQLSWLLEAHETVIREVRQAARAAANHGDNGTNDLLVNSVQRTNELQVRFLLEHLVDVSLAFGLTSGPGASGQIPHPPLAPALRTSRRQPPHPHRRRPPRGAAPTAPGFPVP
jgi:starvation-inducible DNA-binding protein